MLNQVGIFNMKQLIIVIGFLFLINICFGADTVLNAEKITSKKSNQNIEIAPTGTGSVILKDYSGLLSASTGTISQIADGTEGQVLSIVGGSKAWATAGATNDKYEYKVYSGANFSTTGQITALTFTGLNTSKFYTITYSVHFLQTSFTTTIRKKAKVALLTALGAEITGSATEFDISQQDNFQMTLVKSFTFKPAVTQVSVSLISKTNVEIVGSRAHATIIEHNSMEVTTDF